MNKILIIEDDVLIREELKTLLSNAGFAAECVTDFSGTLNQVREYLPDLILLDINLPGRDGFQLCTSIRSVCRTPVLFLTGRGTAMDELQALTLGGDDYIVKPYNVPILLARINLLLKRGRTDEPSCTMEYKGIRIEPVAGTVTFAGKEAELTKTELKIMCRLFEHPGEIVGRMDLVEYLWDNEIHIDDNTLSVNIMRIRDKLHGLGLDGLIQTKRGMGYKI